MKKEIRKKFIGTPSWWRARIIVEDQPVYMLDNGKLQVIESTKQMYGELNAVKAGTAESERRRQHILTKLKTERSEISIDPFLVIYDPIEDAFYKFERFTKQYAVFRHLAINRNTMVAELAAGWG